MVTASLNISLNTDSKDKKVSFGGNHFNNLASSGADASSKDWYIFDKKCLLGIPA